MATTRRPRKLAAEELYEYAVKSLGARAYSSGDLQAKLRSRAARQEDVDGALARLKDHGYLDDRRFAESYAEARVENDGFGRIRLLQDLRTHRVSGAMAEQAVERALGDKSEEQLIDAFIERRMPAFATGVIDDDRKLAAAYRKLRRAGFRSGTILTALKRRAAHPETIEEPAEEEEGDDQLAG